MLRPLAADTARRAAGGALDLLARDAGHCARSPRVQVARGVAQVVESGRCRLFFGGFVHGRPSWCLMNGSWVTLL